MGYPFIERYMLDHCWALPAAELDVVLGIVQARLEGTRLTAEEIEARLGKPPEPPGPAFQEGVLVLPVHGMLAQRANLMTHVSGAMSTSMLGKAVTAAAEDPAIKAILLDVDSPGGSVFGLQEAAERIYQARKAKPIVAVANATAASGAYWLASQAGQFLMTPSGQVGSIGILAAHYDRSRQAEIQGVKQTILSAGKYKAEGHDQGPLDDPAKAALQQKLDQYYDRFLRDVGRGRGVSPKLVREGFGEGRTLGARDAVASGMVDGISTLEGALDSLVKGLPRVPIPGALPAAFSHLEDLAALRARLEALTLS